MGTNPVAVSENVAASTPATPTAYALSIKQVRAARMIADGMQQGEIAAKLGITTRTLQRWAVQPEYRKFQVVLSKYLDEYKRAAVTAPMARREKRIERLSVRHDRYERIIEDRAKDPTMQSVPGGSTGLVVRKVRTVGAGESCQIIEEYEVDTAISAEMRSLLEQIARECGHRERDGTGVKAIAEDGKLTIEVVHIGRSVAGEGG